MPYTVEIIRRDEQNTSTWSGGTTTQLAIYPKTAEYKYRNFLWRLSSACVDAEESTFTSLPGIWRHIMILDGEMTLHHEGQHSALLKPFEQDSFSGSWTTKSIGCARDFNLMLAEGCRGELEAISVPAGSSAGRVVNAPGDVFISTAEAFYTATGEAAALLDGVASYDLHEGDLMVVYGLEPDKSTFIEFDGVCSGTNIIRARLSY